MKALIIPQALIDNAIVNITRCRYDKKPRKTQVDNWVEKDKTYRVLGVSMDPISGEEAIAVGSMAGVHLKPVEGIDAIKARRFTSIFSVCQN